MDAVTRHLRPILRRLRCEERGVALALTLMVVVAISISGAALSQLITSNQTAYARDRQDERAFNNAEAGINYAIAKLSTLNSASYGAFSTIDWTTFPIDDGTMNGSWRAVKSSNLGLGTYWTVYAQATIGRVTRQVKVRVAAPETSAATPSSPVWGLGFFVADPNGCTNMVGNAALTLDIFIAGDLCLNGSQQILEPNASGAKEIDVYVGGSLQISGGAQIGTSTRPILSATIAGGCVKNNKTTPCNLSSKSNVYADTYSSTAGTMTKPPIYPDNVYNSGDWDHPVCSVGSFTFDNDTHRNTSVGTVDILTASAYDCSVYTNGSHTDLVGRLAWNPATKALVISGTIYLDGNLAFAGGDQATYTGFGALYVNGTVRTNGNSAFCGPPATINGSACDGIWDGSVGAISIMAVNADGNAYAWDMAGTAEFNLLVYVVGTFKENGTARVTGPVIADHATVSGTADQTDVLNPPPGTPGSQGTTATSTWGSVIPSSWSRLPNS